MWLATTQGFYSVVEDKRDMHMLVVRARTKGDIKALVDKQLPGLTIHEGVGTDYPYRVFVPRERWLSALNHLSEEIDYTNFKDAVKAKQGQKRADLYMGIWSLLYELTLGRGSFQ